MYRNKYDNEDCRYELVSILECPNSLTDWSEFRTEVVNIGHTVIHSINYKDSELKEPTLPK